MGSNSFLLDMGIPSTIKVSDSSTDDIDDGISGLSLNIPDEANCTKSKIKTNETEHVEESLQHICNSYRSLLRENYTLRQQNLLLEGHLMAEAKRKDTCKVSDPEIMLKEENHLLNQRIIELKLLASETGHAEESFQRICNSYRSLQLENFALKRQMATGKVSAVENMLKEENHLLKQDIIELKLQLAEFRSQEDHYQKARKKDMVELTNLKLKLAQLQSQEDHYQKALHTAQKELTVARRNSAPLPLIAATRRNSNSFKLTKSLSELESPFANVRSVMPLKESRRSIKSWFTNDSDKGKPDGHSNHEENSENQIDDTHIEW